VRAERYGRNTVPPPREATFLELVGEALQDFTVLVLLAAGGLSLGLEAAVHSGGSAGEPSWIEGASILAAGAAPPALPACLCGRALPLRFS
jgi:hypothetical protein